MELPSTEVVDKEDHVDKVEMERVKLDECFYVY
jgi:hypothetical protein